MIILATEIFHEHDSDRPICRPADASACCMSRVFSVDSPSGPNISSSGGIGKSLMLLSKVKTCEYGTGRASAVASITGLVHASKKSCFHLITDQNIRNIRKTETDLRYKTFDVHLIGLVAYVECSTS